MIPRLFFTVSVGFCLNLFSMQTNLKFISSFFDFKICRSVHFVSFSMSCLCIGIRFAHFDSKSKSIVVIQQIHFIYSNNLSSFSPVSFFFVRLVRDGNIFRTLINVACSIHRTLFAVFIGRVIFILLPIASSFIHHFVQ